MHAVTTYEEETALAEAQKAAGQLRTFFDTSLAEVFNRNLVALENILQAVRYARTHKLDQIEADNLSKRQAAHIAFINHVRNLVGDRT